MKYRLLSLFIVMLLASAARADKSRPDTVKAGVYITSIYDIDFKAKEYNITLWLWLKYKKKDFDFLQNLEVPQAKTVTRSFSTVDSTGGRVYLLMKLQCVMKDSWAIENFPFDQQRLRFSIENSAFDSRALVFVPDTLGKHFDPRFTLRGWSIDSLTVLAGTRAYETAFGDDSYKKPHTEYSTFKVRVVIHRDSMGLFWKMFLGMYVAFLIAYMCFHIHADSIDSRFALSVGSLFAVIGNKYIVDSALPESTSFTLVDTLHGITLLFILIIIMSTAYTLRLIKQHKIEKSIKFDIICSRIVLAAYIILNVWFIIMAHKG